MVEVMFVVVISGMITAIGVPKLRNALRQRAVRAAGNELVLAHSLARSTALRFGRSAQLRIDVTRGRFWVDVDTSGTGVRDTIGVIHSVAEQNMQISSNRAVLCFDARGLAVINATCSAGDALIVLRSQNWTDTVRITPLGKVLR
jgi:Tfp pilus assembly protein FimT